MTSLTSTSRALPDSTVSNRWNGNVTNESSDSRHATPVPVRAVYIWGHKFEINLDAKEKEEKNHLKFGDDAVFFGRSESEEHAMATLSLRFTDMAAIQFCFNQDSHKFINLDLGESPINTFHDIFQGDKTAEKVKSIFVQIGNEKMEDGAKESLAKRLKGVGERFSIPVEEIREVSKAARTFFKYLKYFLPLLNSGTESFPFDIKREVTGCDLDRAIVKREVGAFNVKREPVNANGAEENPMPYSDSSSALPDFERNMRSSIPLSSALPDSERNMGSSIPLSSALPDFERNMGSSIPLSSALPDSERNMGSSIPLSSVLPDFERNMGSSIPLSSMAPLPPPPLPVSHFSPVSPADSSAAPSLTLNWALPPQAPPALHPSMSREPMRAAEAPTGSSNQGYPDPSHLSTAPYFPAASSAAASAIPAVSEAAVAPPVNPHVTAAASSPAEASDAAASAAAASAAAANAASKSTSPFANMIFEFNKEMTEFINSDLELENYIILPSQSASNPEYLSRIKELRTKHQSKKSQLEIKMRDCIHNSEEQKRIDLKIAYREMWVTNLTFQTKMIEASRESGRSRAGEEELRNQQSAPVPPVPGRADEISVGNLPPTRHSVAAASAAPQTSLLRPQPNVQDEQELRAILQHQQNQQQKRSNDQQEQQIKKKKSQKPPQSRQPRPRQPRQAAPRLPSPSHQPLQYQSLQQFPHPQLPPSHQPLPPPQPPPQHPPQQLHPLSHLPLSHLPQQERALPTSPLRVEIPSNHKVIARLERETGGNGEPILNVASQQTQPISLTTNTISSTKEGTSQINDISIEQRLMLLRHFQSHMPIPPPPPPSLPGVANQAMQAPPAANGHFGHAGMPAFPGMLPPNLLSHGLLSQHMSRPFNVTLPNNLSNIPRQ